MVKGVCSAKIGVERKKQRLTIKHLFLTFILLKKSCKWIPC